VDAGHLLAFNLALAAAWAVPGPAMLVAMRATFAGGRGAGLATGCGLALAASLWTLLALAGLETVFRLFPWVYVAVKTAGAGYLLWLAWTTWRNAGAPPERVAAGSRRAFLDGVLVNLGNPKSMLFAAAVLVVIFPPEMGWGGKLVVAANHLAFEVCAYGLLVGALSTRAVEARYLGAKAVVDRVAAGVLGALGLRLFVER
jgi:threonine/homoserine/homoserine lactone efflux protein